MSTASPNTAEIRKVLGAHGHAFQYAVLRRSQELFESDRSKWVLEVSEFPVGRGASTTHVDFVLRSVPPANVFLIAECKRANPALGYWCFLQTPYTARATETDELVFQRIVAGDLSAPLADILVRRDSGRFFSNHAFEMKTGDKGDASGSNRDAIIGATTQVLRSMNGFIDQIVATRLMKLDKRSVVSFLPVIFTTAKLFAVRGDLGEADLPSGTLPETWGAFEQVDWLWYSYNQSPELTHSIQREESSEERQLSEVLRQEYTRTIAVVSPTGIDSFLASIHP